MEKGLEINLRECFQVAVDVSQYMQAVQDKTMVQGSRFLPKTIEQLGTKAASGNLDAAKLLFDYLGLNTKQPGTTVATQVNVNLPSLKDVITIDETGNVVDTDVVDG